eukprot:4873397-Heterocapsa_arctica.AAC.1
MASARQALDRDPEVHERLHLQQIMKKKLKPRSCRGVVPNDKAPEETGIIEDMFTTDGLKMHKHAGNMMEANVKSMKVETFVGSGMLGGL